MTAVSTDARMSALWALLFYVAYFQSVKIEDVTFGATLERDYQNMHQPKDPAFPKHTRYQTP